MGQPLPISLGLRTNPGRSNHQAGTAQLINVFAEESGEDGKSVWTIFGTEGLDPFGSPLVGGGIRAMIVVGTTLYAVAGRNVYSVTTGGVGTLLGGIATDGPVYMERNRRIPAQIGIVSDNLYYVIDTGANSLTQIIDVDLPAPISISVSDGFGIIPVVGGSWFLTGLDDFTTIDALDEGTAEAYPDEIVRSMVLEREVIMMGETSLEWFQNTGDADFPFTRVHALELGCLAGDSVAKVDTQTRKTILWVAPDHTVRMMNGYSGQVVSTPEIETLIKLLHRAGNISQLKGFAWAYEGRFFYNLTCNSWSRTWDSKTGNWHSRKSYGGDRWRVSCVVPFGSRMIAGDYDTGQLYVMDSTIWTENGDHLVREIIPPIIHASPYRIVANALYIDAATGVGLNSTDTHESDPKLLVKWSRDSGRTWSSQRERTLHESAEVRRVAPIYRLGKFSQKGMTLSISLSAPVESVTLSIALDFDQLGA
jgi:hypothetical protein